MSNLLPKYTHKGKRLYHRKSTLTPEQRLVSDFFDRFKDEGIISSETGELYHYHKGFICQAFPENTNEGTLYKAIAYTKDFNKEIELVTPFYYKTAREAVNEIHKYIEKYRK